LNLLTPHKEYPTVFDIDYEGLWEKGIRGLIFDLDNTLCPWHSRSLGTRAGELLDRLRERGFKLCILSNGNLDKRGKILEELGQWEIPVIYPAHKPLPFGFRRALKRLGLEPAETAVIGDQLLTDVLGGNLVGTYTILVKPLNPREHFWTRYVARSLERVLGRKLT